MKRKLMLALLVMAISVSILAVAVPVQAYNSNGCTCYGYNCNEWRGNSYDYSVHCSTATTIVDNNWGYTRRTEGPKYASGGYTVYFSVSNMQYFRLYMDFSTLSKTTVEVHLPSGSMFEIDSTDGKIMKNFKTGYKISGVITVYIPYTGNSNVTADVYMTYAY